MRKLVPAFVGAVALVSAALFVSPAGAAQIFVCTGCTSAPGGEPNFIDTGSFNIGAAGSASYVTPLLVLVGEPGSPATAPTLSVPGTLTAAAARYYGLTTATTGNLTGQFEANFTSASSGDAYQTMSLTKDASQSFVNWTTSPFPGGKPNPDIGVTSFSLYAIAVDTALSGTLTGFDFSNIEFGSFVFAYACQTAETAPAACPTGKGGNQVGDTPFSNTGFTPAPPIGRGLPVLLAVGALLSGATLLDRSKKRRSFKVADGM